MTALAAARLLSLSAHERRRVVEAVLSLLLVRLVFGLLPFRRALRLLRIAPGEARPGCVSAAEARDVGRAIARAAAHVPFRAVCLQQAFAALLMLRRQGLAASVHLGLAHGEAGNALVAHAWSRCGAVPVTGGDTALGFVAVAAFTA